MRTKALSQFRPTITSLFVVLGVLVGTASLARMAEPSEKLDDMVRGERPHPPKGMGGDFSGPPMRGPHPLLQLLDQNDDHVVSTEELAAVSARLLSFDSDGDGSLSEDELVAAMPPPGPPPGGPPGGPRGSRRPMGPPPGADF